MKKTNLIILILVILLLLVGIYTYNNISNTKEEIITVADTNFTLPDGYHEGAPNEFNGTNITNGTNTIFFAEYDDTNIDNYVNRYNSSNNKNQPIIKNYIISNTTVFQAYSEKNPKNIHFWFLKNNKTCEIYTWDGNKDINNIVNNFINS